MTAVVVSWAMVVVLLIGMALNNLVNAQVLKRILEAWHRRFAEDGNATRVAMLTAVEMMRDVRTSCDGCRIEVLATIRGAMGEQVERVLIDNRIEHDYTRAAMHEIVEAEGREEDRTVKELQEVNRTLLSLFPQGATPPVLGVGSQVRDSSGAKP